MSDEPTATPVAAPAVPNVEPATTDASQPAEQKPAEEVKSAYSH